MHEPKTRYRHETQGNVIHMHSATSATHTKTERTYP